MFLLLLLSFSPTAVYLWTSLKMTHDDPRLYLISHGSLEKRGLSIGQANIYQMLGRNIDCISPFHFHSCWLM